MLKKVYKQQNAELMKYLSEEASFNLFIIGDIENFGYDSDFQEIWVEYGEKEEIKAVLLRYYKSFIVYAKGEYNYMEVINKIREYEVEALSGKQEILKYLKEEFKELDQREMFFAELNEISDVEVRDDKEIKIATIEDIDKIVELRCKIDEFTTKPNPESLKKTIETKSGRTYFVEENEKMISMAGTVAENSKSAMVVSVCTDPELRKTGYASACTKKLCEDVLNEGKILCLFYDNLKAGKIYKRLGFKDIGMWTMMVSK